jgi:hypothetical protein
MVFTIFFFLVDEKKILKNQLAHIKLLTNFKNPSITRFRDPKAAI